MTALLALILRRLVLPSLATVAALSLTAAQANASLYWNWNYSGNGITASGTFSTHDTADALGFYLITAITGTRNGEMITALQPTGTPIPGNEPFAVDNLVRLDGPQLTHDGFGYAIAGGTYANPFFADFLSPPGYLEFFSSPPFTAGSGTGDSELPIVFAATLAVPEPNTGALVMIGLAMLVHFAARAQRKPLRGVTMKYLIVSCALLLAAPAQARQDWDLVSVTRGATWEVNQANGTLKQSGKILEGVLKDKTDGKADYAIRIELSGEQAQATFRFISENDKGTKLTGFYKKTAKPTTTHCPEQIQLINEFHYIGLARDTCKP